MAHTEKDESQAYADTCYQSAKVVILGNTGVGKTALGCSLAWYPFTPTESTLTRNILLFESNNVMHSLDVQEEQREILLWDLPGQSGYRLINGLHLEGVNVALIAFDYDFSGEADLLASVEYWVHALQQANRAQSDTATSMKMFLVATRADLAALRIGDERIRAIVRKLGFDDYFVTSAKEGLGIAELAAAIHAAIDWSAVPCVRSSKVFGQVKDFVRLEDSRDSILLSVDQLYDGFRTAREDASSVPSADVSLAEFETALRLIASQGLLLQFSSDNLVLLRPELLDHYTSALIEAVREEPDGLGSIEEQRVVGGNFRFLYERLYDREQERSLLSALVEILILQKSAFRVVSDNGTYLVFPSLMKRKRSTMSQLEGLAVAFSFEGDVNDIYTTLIVLLAYSERFKLLDLWANAATFTAQERVYVPRALGGTLNLSHTRGVCGVSLDMVDEAHGSLTVFFDEVVSEEVRQRFEEHIQSHLRQEALPTTIYKQRIIVCSHCGTVIPDQIVLLRRERGFDWLSCPVCDARISLQKEVLLFGQDQDRGRTNTYDVYLCYNSEDRPAVTEIARQLRDNGIMPWLDIWELQPGLSWQRVLDQQIERISTAAVFVGKYGIAPWQHLETEAFLREFLERGRPVIPVILQDASQKPRLPLFLANISWVDFRRKTPDPNAQLVWGITGRRPENLSSVKAQSSSTPTEQVLRTPESDAFGDIEEIRLAIGDKKFRNYRRLAITIMRRMGITEYSMIDDSESHFAFGTAWDVQLPRLGLQLSTQCALLVLRQTELNWSCYDELRTRTRNDAFILLMDIADVHYTPLQADPRMLWFSPDEVVGMVETAPDQLPGWLARFILIKVERDIKLSFLRYKTEEAVDADIFVGREDELRRLSRLNRPGGIIIGAHFSGKSSLLNALARQFRHKGGTVVGPLGIGGNTFQTFFARTLGALHIPTSPDMTPDSWASALRAYHEQQRTRPIFLLDEVDDILAEDAATKFRLGFNMRSLQNEGHCTFYLAGHAKLREYIRLQYSPFQNFAPEELLTGLSEKASKELVQRPMKEVGFNISDEQAHRIFVGTAGIPYLIQDFCLRLLCALPLDQIDKPDIAMSEIEETESSPDYLNTVRHYYQYEQEWDTESVMLMIAMLGKTSRSQIVVEWQKRGLVLKWRHLDNITRFLRDFGVIEIGKDKLYWVKSLYLSQAVLNEEPESLLDDLLGSDAATGGMSHA